MTDAGERDVDKTLASLAGEHEIRPCSGGHPGMWATAERVKAARSLDNVRLRRRTTSRGSTTGILKSHGEKNNRRPPIGMKTPKKTRFPRRGPADPTRQPRSVPGCGGGSPPTSSAGTARKCNATTDGTACKLRDSEVPRKGDEGFSLSSPPFSSVCKRGSVRNLKMRIIISRVRI